MFDLVDPIDCRSVSCDDHVIQEKMTSLRDNGFINYFGMQRFGTSTVPTYHVGRSANNNTRALFVFTFLFVYCLFTDVYFTRTGREQ